MVKSLRGCLDRQGELEKGHPDHTFEFASAWKASTYNSRIRQSSVPNAAAQKTESGMLELEARLSLLEVIWYEKESPSTAFQLRFCCDPQIRSLQTRLPRLLAHCG